MQYHPERRFYVLWNKNNEGHTPVEIPHHVQLEDLYDWAATTRGVGDYPLVFFVLVKPEVVVFKRHDIINRAEILWQAFGCPDDATLGGWLELDDLEEDDPEEPPEMPL